MPLPTSSDPPTDPPTRPVRPASPGIDAALWFLAAFALGLALYAPYLNTFFISDDLSTLAEAIRGPGGRWIDTLRPAANGFWRASNEVNARLLLEIFGAKPPAFHLFALATHALACALTGLVALRILGGSRRAAWLAVLLLATHLGAWAEGLQQSNGCDAWVAIGLLVGLLAWDGWLERGGRVRLAILAAGFLFAILSKETAVVYLLYLALWILVRGVRPVGGANRRRQAWQVVAATGLVAAGYTMWAVYMQFHVRFSYLHENNISLSPKNFLRQLADLYSSAWVPYLHVIEWPGGQPHLPDAFLWSIRLPLLAWLGVLAIRFLRRPEGRWPAALALLAAVGLLPASPLAGRPTDRFIYLALPFVCLLLAWGLTRLRGGRRAALAGAVGVLWTSFVIGFYASPTLLDYRRQANDLSRFTSEVQRLAPGWPRGAEIAIYNYPLPRLEWKWVYAQLVFNVFIPAADAHIVLDQTTSATQRAYRFDGERLMEMTTEPKPK